MNEFIEKLIGRLEEKKDKLLHDFNTFMDEGKEKLAMLCEVEVEAYSEAISIVNELAEEYKGGWIPCSERLPKCHLVRDIFKRPNKWQTDIVLVTVKSTECDGVHYYVAEDYMVGSSKEGVDWLLRCGYGGSAVYHQEIIAWQPLPEPYKKEGAE